MDLRHIAFVSEPAPVCRYLMNFSVLGSLYTLLMDSLGSDWLSRMVYFFCFPSQVLELTSAVHLFCISILLVFLVRTPAILPHYHHKLILLLASEPWIILHLQTYLQSLLSYFLFQAPYLLSSMYLVIYGTSLPLQLLLL